MASMYVTPVKDITFVSDFDPRAPTSGGQYHWVAELAPVKFATSFSWAAGTSSTEFF